MQTGKGNPMQNMFEQFHGADLERLTECLTAIRIAGLKVDKYTQVGVNPNSGNVWVWSEDWAGCVYCSIGFDIRWQWTCCNCGEEYEFDTYREMEDFAQEQNEKTDWSACEACFETAEV
jgi:hypothetical protein